ncbi:MAG: two-component sensor histidine kinase [Coxiellaceae bacterium]|nr:two-component sensor histidine kinase [Coxiellaceae bacterium]
MTTNDHDDYIQQLHKLEKMRQDLIANVSHELRTPLTVFQGYLESLIEDAQGHPWQPIFIQMQQQSTRMEKLVADLLLLARLESDQLITEKKQQIPVPDMINAMCQQAKILNSTHHIIADIDEKLLIQGYENEIHSAFSNLLFNAVYYTRDNGTIHIRWYKETNHAIFSVTDTGIGIDKKHIPRLTERFYRVDKARSRANGGTGLGLAIIKHVLIRHHGELIIDSEVGKGSTFCCRLPL